MMATVKEQDSLSNEKKSSGPIEDKEKRFLNCTLIIAGGVTL